MRRVSGLMYWSVFALALLVVPTLRGNSVMAFGLNEIEKGSR